MRRRYEVELSGTVIVEFDDEMRSEPHSHDGEPERSYTLLDAHTDPCRAVSTATFPNFTLLSLAVILGVENRSLNTDGWADFPTELPYEDRAQAHVDGYWSLDGWREVQL